MSTEELDRVSSLFFYELRSRGYKWGETPSRFVSVLVSSARSAGGKSFDLSQAQEIAASRGYEFLCEFKNSGRLYWRFRRVDAPEVDLVGGPSRDLVRQSPAARREVERVREECGVDVMDPEACYEVEKVAGELAESSSFRWLGANLIFSLGAVIGLISLYSYGSWAVFVPMVCAGVAVAALGIRPAKKAHRRRKDYKVNHLPKVEAVRRVVRAAEDDLRAGWRPDSVAQPGS